MHTTDTTSLRPWIKSYPENIGCQDVIDETPVHEQVLAACAKTPNALALDFLGRAPLADRGFRTNAADFRDALSFR